MIEVRAVHEAEIEAAAICIGRAFNAMPDDLPNWTPYLRTAMTLDNRFTLENTRVVVVDGQIASVVQIADRAMLLQGTTVRQAFISLVGTAPHYRHRGYATLALLDTAAYLRRAGYSLSLVPGEGAEHFYERAGWHNFGHSCKLVLELPDTLPTPPFHGTIRPGDLTRDYEALAAIFGAANHETTGPAIKSLDFWQEFSARWDRPYPLFWVATVDGQVVAYLRSAYNHIVAEWAMAPGANDAAMLALLAHALREARGAGMITLDTIDLGAFAGEVERWGVQITRMPISGYLYRVHDLPLLLAPLLPRMEQRLAASPLAGWSGSVTLDTAVGAATLLIQQGAISMSDTCDNQASSIRLTLTHGHLIDLLFGQANLDHLAITGTLCPNTTRTIVQTLFPYHSFRWYPKDSL